MFDILIEFFKEYGYWGMGVLAFLSGSIVPVASEVLLLFFLGVGLDAVGLTLVAALGNTLGGITCFMMGMLADKVWLMRFFNVTEKRMKQADSIVEKYGYWAAGLSFVPMLGEVLLLVLGMMRANPGKVIVVMAVGKLLRYAFVAVSYLGLAPVFV